MDLKAELADVWSKFVMTNPEEQQEDGAMLVDNASMEGIFWEME